MFCQKGLSFDESNQSEDILSQSGHFRQGSVPYVHLDIGESKVLFCLDSGCSHCLMTPKTYLTLKHVEKVSFKHPAGISLRNITDGVSTNIIETISLIPVFINQKRYILKFYISKSFNQNFLGSDFIFQTKSSIIYNEETDCQTLLINNKHQILDYKFLHEITGQSAIMNIPDQNYQTNSPEKIIQDHILFTKEAFDLYGSEENLHSRAYQILKDA